MKIVLSKFGAVRYVLDSGKQVHRLVDVDEPIRPAVARQLAELRQITFDRPTYIDGAAGYSDYRVFLCNQSLVCNMMRRDGSVWKTTHDMETVYVIHCHSLKHYRIGKMRGADGKIKDHVMRLAERRATDLDAMEQEWMIAPWKRTFVSKEPPVDLFGT